MRTSQKQSKWNKKTKLIATVAVVIALLVGGGVFAYSRFSQEAPSQNPETSHSDSDSDKTKNGQDSPDVDKTHDTGNQGGSTDTPSEPKADNTEIVIVDASQYGSVFEVRAYANAYENGTCTYSFTKGSTTFTKTSAASTGPSTTSCATLDVPTSDFDQKGDWNLTVSYQSATKAYSGKVSKTIIIE